MTSSIRSCAVLLVGCLLFTLSVGCRPQADVAVGNPNNQTSNATSGESTNNGGIMSVQTAPFGKTPAGDVIQQFTCTNSNGLVLKMINYGAIVTAMEVPDRNGKLANVTLGFDSLDGYLKRHPYFGATVGRYCNRIALGKFSIDGQEHSLATNNGANHLHGGEVGYDKVVWQAEPISNDLAVGVKFSYTSPAGEEGYPGTLQVSVEYTLNGNNELKVDFTATTDKKTPVNLTNHCYWNLAGAGVGDIKNHTLQLEAAKYLPVDDGLIPTGELADVQGTPMDFTTGKPIGQDIEKIDADPVGYDHCFALDSQSGQLALAATVKDPGSGRVMKIRTTQPGIQFYTGNFLDESEDSGGFAQHTAFCLETQHYPDSPNQPNFPTTILEPGQTYRQTTVHQFTLE